MAPQRISANELGKLLNSAKEPIYVLDDDLTIVFLNRACQEWLGGAAEGLLGRRCAYHSSPAVAGPDAVAARLCPPPQAPAGGVFTATVSRLADDGTPSERRARFLPLGLGGDDFFAIVAIVETADKRPDERCSGRGRKSLRGNRPARTRRPFPPGGGRPLSGRSPDRARARHAAGPPPGRIGRRQPVERPAGRSAGKRPSAPRRRHPLSWCRRLACTNGKPPPSYTAGLVPLDCSLLGEDLLEAAAAAVAARDQDAVAASGGRTSGDVQVQLADFLARRPPAWRLIATATEPLAELVRRGNFRTDLAALLSTITIELPPLAQRRDDLPLLAQMFLEEHNAAGPRQIGGFSPAALDRLDAYAWPGNLDELAQVVAEPTRGAGGPEIGVEDLPERLHVAAQAAAVPRRIDETIVLDEYLGRVERELIRRALRGPRETRPAPPACWASPAPGFTDAWCSWGWNSGEWRVESEHESNAV